MTTFARRPDPLPTHADGSNRPTPAARRIIGLVAVIATTLGLSACAAGPSFFDHGGPDRAGLSDTSDMAWEGAAKPKPVGLSSASVARSGSLPLLPPVPEETNGLAPIKATAFAD